jgi:S1-C subfamily serine protease
MIQAVVVVNGTRYPVPQQGLRIGRAPENDIVLSDPNISRQHLVVWSTPRGAFLRDLGSQNGTYIAGRRVGGGPEAIPTGAHVRIGVTDLQVEVLPEAGIGDGYAVPQNGGYAGPGRPVVGPGAGPYGGGGAAAPHGGGAAPGPYAGPRAGSPGGGGRSKTGLIIGGVIAVLIVAMVGTGSLVLRAVADSRAAPTPTARPIAVSATSTPAPTAPPKPAATATAPALPPSGQAGQAAPAKPTPAAAKPTAPPAKPTEPPAKPTSPPAPTQAASGGRDPNFVRALNAAVRVIVPTGPSSASTGSGSIITPKGHVLTNFHVVSDDNGRLINQGNSVIIAVPPAEGENAQPKYRAKVADFDAKLDLAIIQLLALADGAALPANLGLNPIPLGTSKSVNIGDTIIIIGFPGLGGSSLTVTRGIHSGIAPPNTFPGDPGTFIKTDTEINRGNSGGTAINQAGELIGIPTAGRIDREAPGKIGLIRPIDEAKPLIDKATR